MLFVFSYLFSAFPPPGFAASRNHLDATSRERKVSFNRNKTTGLHSLLEYSQNLELPAALAFQNGTIKTSKHDSSHFET